jgi:hypothetical protein
MLLDMVGDMLQGYAGPDEHNRDTLREIEDVDFGICMDVGLRCRALATIPRISQHDLDHVDADSSHDTLCTTADHRYSLYVTYSLLEFFEIANSIRSAAFISSH